MLEVSKEWRAAALETRARGFERPNGPQMWRRLDRLVTVRPNERVTDVVATLAEELGRKPADIRLLPLNGAE